MTNNKFPDLLPCPFCGGKHVGIEHIGDSDTDNEPLYYGVMCQRCTARSQVAGTKEKAIENWNERTNHANGQTFKVGQVLFKGLSPIGQYVGFNRQRQKIVTFDGVLEQYREFDISSISPTIATEE